MKKIIALFMPLFFLVGTLAFSASAHSYSEDEIELLSRLIYAEVGEQEYACQIALGELVINRVNNPKFPNDIKSVIYAARDFESIKTREFENPASDRAYRAALCAAEQMGFCGGALYFCPKNAFADFADSSVMSLEIGDCIFYK